MTNDQYTAAVDAGEFPSDSEVPLDAPFLDGRGAIQNLLLNGCRSVAVIDSKRGTTRANHYHKTDWHYTFVARGVVLYFERAVGERGVPEPRMFVAGTMFFTPPNREHCMLFASDSQILTFARNRRDHEGHEADVVRVDFITPALAAQYVP